MVLEITLFDVTILDDYAPARVRFDIAWSTGNPDPNLGYGIDFYFGDGKYFYAIKIFTESYSYTHTYQNPGIYNYEIEVYDQDYIRTLYGSVTIPTTQNIKETIGWEASVPNHGIVEHTFYLFSLYGINTNNTIGGFQIYNGFYQLITTISISRIDNLTTSNVSQFDCLTMIAENYDGSTISGIYDWRIDNSVI